MFSPKRLVDFDPMAKAYGLRLAYVPSDEPELTDDEIEIYCEEIKTPISIQVGQCGRFYLNEHVYKDGQLACVRHHGEFRSLSVAIDRALTLASQDAPYAN